MRWVPTTGGGSSKKVPRVALAPGQERERSGPGGAAAEDERSWLPVRIKVAPRKDVAQFYTTCLAYRITEDH